jgi:ubiquinone/menaquinone biosynthesis C-methylase UbiE
LDSTRFSTIAHRDLVLCNPIGSERMDRVLALLEAKPGERALDVGCGKAEVLLRLIERYGVSGVGVDTNAEFLAEARSGLARRAPQGELVLHACDVADFAAEPESFDIALCTGSTHAYGGYRRTLRAQSALVRPGGHLVIGEGYWKREPDPEYLALLGGTRDEFADHAGNVQAAVEEGLVPLFASVSSDDDWDQYEGTYALTVERHVRAHPEDADGPAMLARIRRWCDGYLRWGRDTLGFALYLFRRD